MDTQDKESQDEGMSTKTKIAAGAALGVAVPAAVGVAKKLMGGGDDGEQDETDRGEARPTADRTRSAASRTRSAAGTATKRASDTTRSATRSASKRKGSAAKSTTRTASSASKRAGSAAKSTRRSASTASSRARRSTSSTAEKTKEQLYNEAKRLGVEGRSTMNKTQLKRAVARKRS